MADPQKFLNETDFPCNDVPRPFAVPQHPPEPTLGDLTMSSVADNDNLHQVVSHSNVTEKPPATAMNVRDNLRPPVSSRHGVNKPLPAVSRPENISQVPRRGLNSVSASPGKANTSVVQSLSTGRTPTVRRIGSAVGQSTPSSHGKPLKTPANLGRTGSTASTLGRPHQPALKQSALTSVKKGPTPNASLMMNESVMSFATTGELDAEGNLLTKSEEERTRIEIEVNYMRIMQYQILRAMVRKAAEAQGRSTDAQLGAVWEETQRLRESAAEKRAEAADIRRQRELHLAARLGGAALLPDEEHSGTPQRNTTGNSNTPMLMARSSGMHHSDKRIRSKPKAESAESGQTDLRTVCELLGPTMKDLSLLAGSIDKTRHALPLKNVINASPRDLTNAMHYFEGALVDMPKLAKMAVGTQVENSDMTAAGEVVKAFRETAANLGQECLQTAEALQTSGEMVCHVLAMEECARLKGKSYELTQKPA